MIAHVGETQYSDKEVAEDCMVGWRVFCIEVLLRTRHHMAELCKRHRTMGAYGMRPTCRKEWEILLRQVAAYRWVFDKTGGDFTFAVCCEDLGLDPDDVRERLVSHCRPRKDIRLLVDWVIAKEEKTNGKGRRPVPAGDGVGSGIVDAVRSLRRSQPQRACFAGGEARPVCRYQDRNQGGRRSAGEGAGRHREPAGC